MNKSLENKLRFHLDDLLWSQLWDQIKLDLYEQLRDNMIYTYEMREQLWNEIKGSLENQLYEDLG